VGSLTSGSDGTENDGPFILTRTLDRPSAGPASRYSETIPLGTPDEFSSPHPRLRAFQHLLSEQSPSPLAVAASANVGLPARSSYTHSA